jgi:hypothetical protein
MIGRWTVLNGVLLVIVVLLGFQTARTWQRLVPPLRMPVAAGPGEVPARREAKAKPAVQRDGNGQEMVALITSMDLFDSTRQAVGTTAAAAPVELPPPTGIEVVGIRLLGDDEEAFIRDATQQNAQRRVRTGDEVAGYTVQSINPTSVELANPTGQTVTLWMQLTTSSAPKPGVPGVPRPNVPPVPGRPAQPPPLDPRAAARQRLRQERLQQRRGGVAAPPSLPAGVRQLRDQMQKGA